MKPLVILMALVAGCAQTARPIAEGTTPDRGDIVLTGTLAEGSDLRLAAADGRVYAVRARGSRFAVTLPAGVYEVTSIDGVRPVAPWLFHAVPGDRIELARASSVAPRETPLAYSTRTGDAVRPLPVPANWGGGSRAGMGLGLRSR